MDDIDRILSEEPIISKPKIQTYGKAKKPIFKKIFNRRTLIFGGIILFILAGFLLVPSCECEPCKVCDTCMQEISITDIKAQIISKGYVELNNGELKLAPYLG